jgi:CHASE3 domain sensor protein
MVMNAKMSLSEKIVAGLFAVLLVAGFASGVFAKPTGMSFHSSSPVTRVQTPSSPGM